MLASAVKVFRRVVLGMGVESPSPMPITHRMFRLGAND